MEAGEGERAEGKARGEMQVRERAQRGKPEVRGR